MKLIRGLVKKYKPAIVGFFHQQLKNVGYYTCW